MNKPLIFIAILVITLSIVAPLTLVNAQARKWVKVSDLEWGYGPFSKVYAYVEGVFPVPSDGHLYDVNYSWAWIEPYPYIIYCHQAIPGYKVRPAGDEAYIIVWSSIVRDGKCIKPNDPGFDKVGSIAKAEIAAPPPGGT